MDRQDIIAAAIIVGAVVFVLMIIWHQKIPGLNRLFPAPKPRAPKPVVVRTLKIPASRETWARLEQSRLEEEKALGRAVPMAEYLSAEIKKISDTKT
jgi:hypothetical protein